MTLTGLNTVNLSTLNTFQQFMLFLLIILGSGILVSAVVVNVRKRAFERKLQGIVGERHRRRQARRPRRRSFRLPSPLVRQRSQHNSTATEPDGIVLRGRPFREHGDECTEEGPSSAPDHSQIRPSQIPLPPSRDDVDLEQGVPVSEADTTLNEDEALTDHIHFVPLPPQYHGSRYKHRRVFSGAGVGAVDLDRHPRNASQTTVVVEPTPESTAPRGSFRSLDKYLKTVNGLVGRNSQFHNLTLAEREELGGLEYQAVSLLNLIVPIYFLSWQFFGAIGCGAYVNSKRPDVARENGFNPWWVGSFFAISAFNKSGMALLDANMTAFQTSYYMLLTLSLLILAGNTCFPPFLRLIIWAIKRSLPDKPKWQERRKVLEFILDHPRRTYTHLFPSRETWFLVGSLVVLNGIDWFAFGVLDIGNKAIATVPVRFRVLDGLFQAFAIRSGGFYVFPIPSLRPGLLVLYVLMMYISVYPVTMTMRNTNTYEERSLGVYAEDLIAQKDATSQPPNIFGSILGHASGSGRYFIRQQLHNQLAHDLWWLALAVLFITIVETSQFERDPAVFSVFNILFEIVSGYGCVGVSTGVPWNAYSFCGTWHTTSKLILCAVMLRGRHRGLPVAIDKAILLPDRTLALAEEEDAAMRLDRSLSRQRSVVAGTKHA